MNNTVKLFVLILGLASLATNVLRESSSSEAQQLHFSSSKPPLKLKSCKDCHPAICKKFENAPHTRSLTPANDPEMIKRYAGKEFEFKERGIKTKFYEKDGDLYIESNTYKKPFKVDFVFGSGTHAQTLASVYDLPNGESRMITHQVSWYPGDFVDVTLGMDNYHFQTGRRAIAEYNDFATTRSCFGCHLTHFPVKEDKRLDFDNIDHGVSCERCHQHGEKHIYEAENGIAFTRPAIKKQTPLEAIRQCGECHRRADQLTRKEIDPDRSELVRFAPVGLSQSKCFTSQGDNPPKNRRLDCVTCHDPHQPASREPQFYNDVCLNCHGTKPDQANVCADSPMTSNCLECHMPGARQNENLVFTDHWIRIIPKDQIGKYDTKNPY